MIFNSIRWKIQAWYGVLLIIVVMGLAIAFYQYAAQDRYQELDENLRQSLTPILPKVFPPPRGRRPVTQDRIHEVTSLFSREEMYLVAWSIHQTVKLRTGNVPEGISYPNINVREDASFLRTRGHYRELVFSAVRGRSLVIGISTIPVEKGLRRLGAGLFGIATLVVVLGLAGGWWLANRAIRPIARISETANHIANGDLSKRINIEEAENELGQLCHVLNQTFDKVEKTFDQQVKFTADASHELRTPVSVILAKTQLALSRERSAEEYKSSLEVCQKTAQKMRGLIESLLELARMDSGELQINKETYNLSNLVRENVALIKPLAEEKKISVTEKLKITRCSVDKELIGQVITNLLTNAIKYNREGGKVMVSTKRTRKDVVLIVEDTGEGMPKEAALNIFDRFYRVDKSRARVEGSSGLGLAISKAIISAHGGTIRAESELGKGTKVIVELPRKKLFSFKRR